MEISVTYNNRIFQSNTGFPNDENWQFTRTIRGWGLTLDSHPLFTSTVGIVSLTDQRYYISLPTYMYLHFTVCQLVYLSCMSFNYSNAYLLVFLTNPYLPSSQVYVEYHSFNHKKSICIRFLKLYVLQL